MGPGIEHLSITKIVPLGTLKTPAQLERLLAYAGE
jgi:hypothetical protein